MTTCPRCKQPTSSTLAGEMCFTPDCSQVEVLDTRNLQPPTVRTITDRN